VLRLVFGVLLGVAGYGVHRILPANSQVDWLVTACWLVALTLVTERDHWDMPVFALFVTCFGRPFPQLTQVGVVLLVCSLIRVCKLVTKVLLRRFWIRSSLVHEET
jgi:hypothetical protein